MVFYGKNRTPDYDFFNGDHRVSNLSHNARRQRFKIVCPPFHEDFCVSSCCQIDSLWPCQTQCQKRDLFL